MDTLEGRVTKLEKRVATLERKRKSTHCKQRVAENIKPYPTTLKRTLSMAFPAEKANVLPAVQAEIISLLAKHGYTYGESDFILDDVKRQLMEQVVQLPHGRQSTLDDMANALKRNGVSLLASIDDTI